MLIYGEKVVLRGVEEYDNCMLLSLINDPETEMMLGESSWPVSEAEQLRWFENLSQNKNSIRCIVAIKEEEKKAVGTVILNEIDMKNGTGHIHIKMVKEEGRGKGYGTDAVKTLVKYAFDYMRLNCIYANILPYNKASIRLFEKCGFQLEGILRARVFKSGKYMDVLAYSITNSGMTED